jgi:uncharacterized membrane protein
MVKKQVVIATFPDEAAADAAVVALKEWDKASDDVKLNSVGVMVLDEDGQLKTSKLGRRSVGTGAGIGLVLALISPVGIAAGVVGGGLLGALHHKGLGMKSEDREQLAAELRDGNAAVGVLAAPDEAETIAGKLRDIGGTVRVQELSEETLQQANAASAVAQPT